MTIADFLTYAGPVFIVVAVLAMIGGILAVERVSHADELAADSQD